MGEEDERKHEEKQRARGPEGQRPLIPNKVCVQQVKHQEGRKTVTFCSKSLRCTVYKFCVLPLAQSRPLERQDLSGKGWDLSQKLTPQSR